MSAIQIGGMTALQAYRSGTISGYNDDQNSYPYRAQRYDQYQYWDTNTMFDSINGYMTQMRANQRLYRHIRGIYNPVHRLINQEVANTYGGGIDWTGGLRTGAIPVSGADDKLIEAITTILKWSNFGTEKGPFVRQGAKLGESYLKIVDDVERKRVRMEVLNPYYVRDVRFNEVGDIKFIAIQYYRTDDEGKDYIYREEIDQKEFRFWREYNLNSFNLEKSDPDDGYDNPYGFVPVRQVPHTKETDSRHGRPSFNGVLGKIVQLNDIAAPVHDAVRLSVNPLYVSKGGIIPDNRDDATRDRDVVKTITIAKDGDLFALAPTLNIMDGLAAMTGLIKEIESDLPQLALARMREEGGDVSGKAARIKYSDAANLIIETQGIYDEGLIRALQMAISIAAYRGLEPFRAYDPIKSYERGDLDFYINERDVFSDQMTQQDRIRLLNESVDKPTFSVVARDLGVSEEDIAEIEAAKSKSAADTMRGLAQAAFGEMGEDEDEEPVQAQDEIDVQEEVAS